MQKSKLDKFIQKYNLGGNVNSVKWKSDGNTLSTSFVTPDKSLLGNVKVDKFSFDSAELGIYQTDQLKSLIGVLGDDISLDLTSAGDRAISLKAALPLTKVLINFVSSLILVPNSGNLLSAGGSGITDKSLNT